MYKTLAEYIGNTPLVALNRLNPNKSNVILLKLEGNNPAGSVKDRPAFNMISQAEKRGEIAPGDTLIEATSGNTGIALAMVAAMKGYTMILIMPEDATEERKANMAAYGAKLIEVSADEGMEGARDLALQMQKNNKGKVLNQFGNNDNWRAHYATTAPEIWRDTNGEITHFISSMGTTGTITGCSRYFKEHNPQVQIIGLQPTDNSRIPGIRRWPKEYMPDFFEYKRVDSFVDVNAADAVATAKQLASEEAVFCGISSGGNVWAALELSKKTSDAVIVTIGCDRAERYLSSGVFSER